MTIRATLTVALAAALLAASLPVVDRARVNHADTQVASELERLEQTAAALATRNDPVPAGETPARVAVTLHLPSRSWGSAGLDRLRFPPPGGDATIRWRVEGGRAREIRPSPVAIVGPPSGLTVAEGGTRRVVLELRVREGRRTVVVRRPSFIPEDATREPHVRPRGAARPD